MGKQKMVILDGLSENQRIAAECIDRDVLVRAGAGSGKTKTLVARYLYLLDEHRDWHPSDITAVTFTRKAAREMQSRIRKEMSKLAYLPGNDADEKNFWLSRLNEMDSANIGTIHSLCGRILRAYPAEAGLDPAFGVLDDNNAALLTAQIVEETISKISADRDYEVLLNFYDGSRLTKILSDMLKSRVKTDACMSRNGVKTADYLKIKVQGTIRKPEYTDIIDDYCEAINEPGFDKKADYLADRIKGLVAAYQKGLEMMQTDCHAADAAACICSAFEDWDFRKGNRQLKSGAMSFRNQLTTDFPFLKKDDKGRDIAWYKDFWDRYDAAEECLRKLWPQIRDAYTRMMDAAQMIDFDAMESLTLDLLNTRMDIRDHWGNQVKALLVDEFQDTNDAQAELFTLLDPSHDRLFAVGDKKQSIYGFRGTNVALFDRRGVEVKKFGGKDVLLNTTYRTEPELLIPMGGLLETVMADDDLSQKDYYAAYEAMNTPEIRFEKPDPLPKCSPCIELLLGEIQDKEDDPDGEIVGRMLASRLTELMNTGLIHSWDDAAILCRNSNEFKQFENALESWHIPYVTVSGKGYYDRPEIRDILNTLRTAENPYDNAALTGYLLSPSIGFTLEMAALLYRYANKGGLKKSFYQALMDEDFCFEDEGKQKKLERARTILRELVRISGQVPLDEALEEAYRLTGIRTMLALNSGDRAWLNLDKLIPAARESGLTSVSEFLDYLDKINETGSREGEAPSDNNGAVRIMTIHQAKGLEFRVTVIAEDYARSHSPQFTLDTEGAPVFYSSPTTPRYADAQKLSDDRDKAEWLRLFYVAATRAEYRLILCGKKPDRDGSKDSWLKRAVRNMPDEDLQPGDNTLAAWGINGQTVLIRICTKLPEVPPVSAAVNVSAAAVKHDFSLLDPIGTRSFESKREEHTAALTVGKLVHKGMELWRFPESSDLNDPVLANAFKKILMCSDSLDEGEQRAVQEKAVGLLNRFRNSDVFLKIDRAAERRHELPFSYTGKNFTVNGVIDLLMKDSSGKYSIIDFKTDELKSESDLAKAIDNHRMQIEKYRKALNITLGAEAHCDICFLDYCGKVVLQPIGKDAATLIGEAYDDWMQDEPEPEELWPEEQPAFGDLDLMEK